MVVCKSASPQSMPYTSLRGDHSLDDCTWFHTCSWRVLAGGTEACSQLLVAAAHEPTIRECQTVCQRRGLEQLTQKISSAQPEQIVCSIAPSSTGIIACCISFAAPVRRRRLISARVMRPRRPPVSMASGLRSHERIDLKMPSALGALTSDAK